MILQSCPLPPSEAYQMVVEQIVETDEELMNRYLEGETIEPDELRKAAHDAIASGKVVPVLCVCTKKEAGLNELLDLITACGLSPADIHRFGSPASEAQPEAEEQKSEVEIPLAEDGTLVALVFKTSNDQFMGKMSYLRILSGRLTPDTTLVNLRSGKTGKAGHVYVMQGKQQEEVAEAIAGDLVAIAKFDDLHVSDTVSNVGGNTTIPALRVNPIAFPTPMVPRAVEPKAREDETKISVSLAKIADEDPTFTYRRDAQTHELVISGHERAAPGHYPAAAEEPLQAGREYACAACALPGDDSGECRGEPSAQEAVGRARPVWRGAFAGASAGAWEGFQLCGRCEGWGDSQPVHSGC